MSYIVWGIIVPPLMGVLYYHTFLAITQDECVAKKHNNRYLGMFYLKCFTICHVPKPILYLKHCRNNDLAILDRGGQGPWAGCTLYVYVQLHARGFSTQVHHKA